MGPLAEGYLHAGLPGSRVAAMLLLGRQRGAQLVPQLRRILAGTPRCRGKVARRAFWQMFRLGEATLPTVLDMLASDNWRERKAAVCLLKRWGKLTLEYKARALGDAHVAVRCVVN